MYSAIINEFDPPREDIKVYTFDVMGSPRLSSKLYKALSHLFDSEWSVWVDGDIRITPEKEKALIDELQASGKEIGFFKHPWRDCIYEEAQEVLVLGKDTEDRVLPQMARYKSEGYPEHNGLVAGGIIVRHNTPRMRELNNQWWIEICLGSKRDQISIPYVFRDYHTFSGNIYDYKI